MEFYDEMEENSVNEPTTDKFSEAFSKYNMKVDTAWINLSLKKPGKRL